MEYPLYEFYSKSSLNLYEIRKHFIENFYYQKHSRREADSVLKSIIDSSKINKLFQVSIDKNIALNYEDFLVTICSMFKFMFKSNDTQILAVLDAALNWDIEVNSKLNIISSDNFKQDILKVFKKYQVYKEMTKEEFQSFTSIAIDSMEDNNPISNESKTPINKTSWSLSAFTKEFGKMKIGTFVNKETGDSFTSCVFTNEKGNKTFVSFSTKLGELTPEEIENRKDELLIVKNKSGKYNLVKAKKGTWKDVNI